MLLSFENINTQPSEALNVNYIVIHSCELRQVCELIYSRHNTTICEESILYDVLVASEPTRYRPHNLKLNILFGGRFVNKLFNKKILLLQIGIKRKVMYRRAKIFGYTHPLVVSCSQELDVLIDRYLENYSTQDSGLSYLHK